MAKKKEHYAIFDVESKAVANIYNDYSKAQRDIGMLKVKRPQNKFDIMKVKGW